MRLEVFATAIGASLFAASALGCAEGQRKTPPGTGEVSRPSISRERAAEIARRTATAEGIKLADYQLLEGLQSDGKTAWVFAFACAPQPAPPGCGFVVHVDWDSGKAELLWGQ